MAKTTNLSTNTEKTSHRVNSWKNLRLVPAIAACLTMTSCWTPSINDIHKTERKIENLQNQLDYKIEKRKKTIDLLEALNVTINDTTSSKSRKLQAAQEADRCHNKIEELNKDIEKSNKQKEKAEKKLQKQKEKRINAWEDDWDLPNRDEYDDLHS